MNFPSYLKIDMSGPLISLNPRDRAFLQDPYPAYRAIRETAPMFYWQEYGFWCAASYHLVFDLLRDRRFGNKAPNPNKTTDHCRQSIPAHLVPYHKVATHFLSEHEPPEHTRLRALVSRAFVSRQVERLRPHVAALATSLIDDFASSRSVDLVRAYATPIPVTLIAELLGVPTDIAPQLLDWSHRIAAMYQYRRNIQIDKEAAAATQEFSSFLRSYVADRRSRPGDGLIDHLIATEGQESQLNEDELVANCILLLVAGHETVAPAIANGVKTLLETGISSDTISNAGETLIEEILRFEPSLHMLYRFALEDVSIGPAQIKKGDRIGILIGSASRDDTRFSEPDRFVPDRVRAPHVSFGGGIHFCVGAPLARLELEVALPILFARLPGMRLAGTPTYDDTYHFRHLKALEVAW